MSPKTYDLRMGGFTYKDCWFEFAKYGNDSLAILIESEDGPVGRATVNLEQAPSEGCVWIKDYSENEGLAVSLYEHGLIAPTGRSQRSGFIVVREYRLMGDWADAAL